MSSKITIVMKNIQYLIALYYPYIPNVSIIHEGIKKRNIPHNWSVPYWIYSAPIMKLYTGC